MYMPSSGRARRIGPVQDRALASAIYALTFDRFYRSERVDTLVGSPLSLTGFPHLNEVCASRVRAIYVYQPNFMKVGAIIETRVGAGAEASFRSVTRKKVLRALWGKLPR